MDIVGKAKDAPDGRGRRRDTGTGADTDSAPLKRVLGRTPNSPTASQPPAPVGALALAMPLDSE